MAFRRSRSISQQLAATNAKTPWLTSTSEFDHGSDASIATTAILARKLQTNCPFHFPLLVKQ